MSISDTSPGSGAASSSSAGRYWLLQLIIALAWIGLWYIGHALEYAPHASLWFPPAALTYAAFRVGGWRAIPGVASAALVVTFGADGIYELNLPPGLIMLSGLLFATVHGLAYYAGAWFMADYLPRHAGRSIPRSVTAFLIVGAIASLLAALAGAYALAWTGMMSWSEADVAVLPWWIGDFAGLLTLGPLLIVAVDKLCAWLKITRRMSPEYHSDIDFDRARGRRGFLIKLALGLGMMTLTVAMAALFPSAEPIAFLSFFVIIPQMWLVHTEGEMRTVISVAVLATGIALATRLFGVAEQALTYQFLMIIIAASSYFGIAVPTLYANNRELREALNRDGLTQAVTRNRFFEIADMEMGRAVRYGERLSLIVFDVDNFKEINDRFGHATGDDVLISLTDKCRSTLRPSDVFGRIGGDEFAILLPMTSAKTAAEVGDRLRQVMRLQATSDRPEVTSSFGVAEVRVGQESFKQALERADRLLYRAKQLGRDRVSYS